MIPGTYRYKDVEFKVNSLGFLGEEFSIKNEKGCRIISFGGSTTVSLGNYYQYKKILEESIIQTINDSPFISKLSNVSLKYTSTPDRNLEALGGRIPLDFIEILSNPI